MRASDIVNKSDQRSINRAHKQNLNAKLYKVENSKILYTVDSSEGDKKYIVEILLLGLTGNKLKSLKSALSSDIKISCTCPAFLYQGYKYITYSRQAGINKETRAPNKTNPERKGMACKHIIAALEQMKLDYSKIYDMFKANEPKNTDKPVTTDIKNNYKSKVPTELDIQIVDDFKQACDKLYSNYTKYLKSNPADDAKFVDSQFYDKSDPSELLNKLSKPVKNSLKGKFIGKCMSLDSILSLIDQKKNGFNVMLDSDIKALTKKLNSVVSTANESLINDIILYFID